MSAEILGKDLSGHKGEAFDVDPRLLERYGIRRNSLAYCDWLTKFALRDCGVSRKKETKGWPIVYVYREEEH